MIQQVEELNLLTRSPQKNAKSEYITTEQVMMIQSLAPIKLASQTAVDFIHNRIKEFLVAQ